MLDALETARRSLQANTPEGDADALSISDDILQRDPASAHALYLAGTSLLRMKQKGLATSLLNAASQLNPGSADIWNNLGCALQEWHPADAVKVFTKALEADDGHTEAGKNLAACLGRIGKRDHAIEIGQKLWAKRPDDTDIPYNLALDLLHTADWKAAFAAYEYSEGNAQRTIRNYHADKQTPRWDGKDNGQKVVIFGEQGVGDEIWASHVYTDLIKAYPKTRFVFECDPRLESLFKRSFPDATIYGTRGKRELDWPTHEQPDAALIAFAAVGLMRETPQPAAPWLVPDPEMVAFFKGRLAALGPGPKIGLSWSGGATDWDRAERTISTELLGPVMSTPGGVVVSLEYVDGPKPAGIHELTWATRKGVDIDVTCALIGALDAVVSVPQTVCDIAGAIGVELMTLVSPNPPWRFAEAAGDAWIWENVRTYRRQHGATWLPALATMAREYREREGLI